MVEDKRQVTSLSICHAHPTLRASQASANLEIISKEYHQHKKKVYLCSMSNAEIIASFSKNLFWDVDPETIDLETNSRYVIQRVLEYGRYNDWKLILSYYGIQTISDTATSLRSLDPKAVSFISAITNIPKEQFRCYTLRQSSQRHWNF